MFFFIFVERRKERNECVLGVTAKVGYKGTTNNGEEAIIYRQSLFYSMDTTLVYAKTSVSHLFILV